jgi:hypothetical protein
LLGPGQKGPEIHKDTKE